ncbi:MAG: T9SS C-terminal target domain-containing protein [Calditrichaeota bacterium]|nr:MAG: T9SS C-terminal target domain-containing protein [Calditrichota bacterium]
MHVRQSFIFFFFSILICTNPLRSQNNIPRVLINEFMAANKSTINNPAYDAYSDWIEIYNAEDSVVNLGGFYLTDDFDDPQKWQIPTPTVIRPGWRLFFWADGQDSGIHTNFKLAREGEQLGLFTPAGIPVDTLSFPAQITDISCGRYPDGANGFSYFDLPTPSSSNKYPGFGGIVVEPVVLLKSGFYEGIQQLEITVNAPRTFIRYTTDGSIPGDSSAIYSSPLTIAQTTVIRAQAFRQGYIPSAVVTSSIFIDESVSLPVFSVVTDPENLWDDQTGIYVEGENGVAGYCSSDPKNWNQDWERPVHLSFFEKDRVTGFELDAGMKIGGGCTRKYPLKSLAIYARSEYGASKIEYPLFADKNITSFNNLVLRNGGQDFYRTIFRDGLMQTLVKNKMNIDWQAYRPVVVFLNGEYWGIHGLREKHNEHFFAQNYGLDADKIDLLVGNASVKTGSADDYKSLISFVNNNDMNVPQNYAFVKTQMEVDEYINYQISEIFYANVDWPANNIKFWRPQSAGSKWRWLLFDTDLGFGAHPQGQYFSNTLNLVTSGVQTYYANPTWSTLLFRKLLTNDEFRAEFIQRFAAHMVTTFESGRSLAVIDSLQSLLAPEVPRHKEKWPKSLSFGSSWETQVEIMREFARKRPEVMLDHLLSIFELSGRARLRVSTNNPVGGEVRVSGVTLPNNFSGLFFKEIPLRCEALPAPGYRFVGWQGISEESNNAINIVLNLPADLQANFQPAAFADYAALRINEIMAVNNTTLADAAGEYDDWIEIYNASDRSINLAGLFVTDDLSIPNKWQIPSTNFAETTIEPGGYKILWADNQPEQGLLHVNFKLSGNGEYVGLAFGAGEEFSFIDSLQFGTQTADISFGRAESDGIALTFFESPTPGAENGIISTADELLTGPHVAILEQNFPNPFRDETTINFLLPEAARVSLQIFNSVGKHIITLDKNLREAGKFTVIWDGKNGNGERMAAGLYFCRLQAGNEFRIRKLLYIP